MLTQDQKKWIAHLSNKDTITIVPFDPTAEQKYQKIKQKIQDILGKDIPVEHRGATSLGISGQNEIDIYIPISPAKFNSLIKPLSNIFGQPRSLYPLERVRFVTEEDGKHIDIFLINKKHNGWINGIKFENYLRVNSKKLDEYRKLKENGNGISVREYYKRKIEFINLIIKKIDSIKT
ncbi:MAG: GrpB family protein [Candidatus Daviesbacteria bacterium]|nr:GrpB family protein [Candidatus Daviesbacteria bacterium]